MTNTDDRITPGERRELRSVVRQQMKVLRTEIKQRREELIAEAESRLVEKYRDEDRRADELGWRIRQIADEANRALEDALRDYEDLAEGGKWAQSWNSTFRVPQVHRKNEDRSQLHRALVAGIESQVRQAELQLQRQEADLLRDLAMESLETSAARAFLGRIPTVAELVPSRRLREIETQFDEASGAAS
jgi:lipopolysaccharide biosynthesis regulator YciM